MVTAKDFPPFFPDGPIYEQYGKIFIWHGHNLMSKEWKDAHWSMQFMAACACEHLWYECATEKAAMADHNAQTGLTAMAAVLLEAEADAAATALRWHELAKQLWAEKGK